MLYPLPSRADPVPISSFWFVIDADFLDPGLVYSFDLPISSLTENFDGILPLFDPSMMNQLFPAALVSYSPREISIFELSNDPAVDFLHTISLIDPGIWQLGDNSNLSDGPDTLGIDICPEFTAGVAVCPDMQRLGNSLNIFITAHPITATELTWPEPATSVLLLSGLVMGGFAAKRTRASEKRRSSRL